MKIRANFRLTILNLTLVLFCCNLYGQTTVLKCYENFIPNSGITKNKIDILSNDGVSYRTLPTNNGNVQISRVEGMRIIYHNAKDAPFINLKVEISSPEAYENDTTNLINYLSYVVPLSQNYTSKKVLRIKKNGYTLYGFSASKLDAGKLLSSFVFFPKKDIIVYVDFLNVNQSFRSYSNIIQFNEQVNAFLESYTLKIKDCQ